MSRAVELRLFASCSRCDVFVRQDDAVVVQVIRGIYASRYALCSRCAAAHAGFLDGRPDETTREALDRLTRGSGL